MKETSTIVAFPRASSFADCRALRKKLFSVLRSSRSPVIVDFSNCTTLDHEDISLLLECLAEVAGRDTKLLLVAGSRVNRVLLEVTRISSLAPVFNSLVEALAFPQIPSAHTAENLSQSQPGSA